MRANQGMAHVDQRLVSRENKLIKLFDPPFDKSNLEPGYIKGYLPGVRENGGQYTHAAVWTVMAYAAMHDNARAWELFNLINPVHHGDTAEKISTYKVEPFVMAADVYGVSPHIGRGGWTWYTGSAGWTYRLITESLLGLHLHVDTLHFTPCIPAEWKSYKIHYRYRETFFHITINNPAGGKVIKRVVLDGTEQADQSVHLVDDRNQHYAEVELG
jgi:cellobiose phosphorylase